MLTGTTNNLRQQTQDRLDREFAGVLTAHKVVKNIRGIRISRKIPAGVGKIKTEYDAAEGKRRSVAAFTSWLSDFSISTARGVTQNIETIAQPAYFVIKKNQRVLRNLYNWLKDSCQNAQQLDTSLLLIDDEADNASVNTSKEDEDPTAINACIRSILGLFKRASYLAVTATPYANIFIDPDTDDDMLKEDLFPSDFIYVQKAPSNYIGAEKIFGNIDEPDGSAEYAGMLEYLDPDEVEQYFPHKHKKDFAVTALPGSLYEAVYYFMLINALRDARGDRRTHRSMLIHISRFTAVQDQITDLLGWKLDEDIEQIKANAKLPAVRRDQTEVFRKLRKVWDKFELEEVNAKWLERRKIKCRPLDWDTLCSKYLKDAVSSIKVRSVNQNSSELEYLQYAKEGFRVIVVGGNNLSRGLTLEGLAVSYFYRTAHTYDTLMQMGRWFGFRPNYEDLVKIWITDDTAAWYREITSADLDLKDQIRRMPPGRKPADFGLCVRQDPITLYSLAGSSQRYGREKMQSPAPTSGNKMRSTGIIKRYLNISRKVYETSILPMNMDALKANESFCFDFISKIGGKGAVLAENSQEISDGYYWKEVPNTLIAELISKFKHHTQHPIFFGRNLEDYIMRKDKTKWEVALMFSGDGHAFAGLSDAELPVCNGEKLVISSTENRTVEVSEHNICFKHSRVGSRGCCRAGLTHKERRLAAQAYCDDKYKLECEAAARNGLPLPDKKNQYSAVQPDQAYLIEGRNPLLMIHFLEVRDAGGVRIRKPLYVTALGIGFPGSTVEERTMPFVANKVALRTFFGQEEDDGYEE
ncbi:MAG: Z1 domain-containing protein [Proteobacteria bacterium]|uniref:Z1 domain-containing protein n=1 Tax=Candidatus Avisuccinivibrio stercorigallinarum TaxID=2840704 RepID=A0A9D9GTA7_9GAMM|nr:Z1 domain-containing protein [Candidatus Avisuccinivibrio stercorigallinarum]